MKKNLIYAVLLSIFTGCVQKITVTGKCVPDAKKDAKLDKNSYRVMVIDYKGNLTEAVVTGDISLRKSFPVETVAFSYMPFTQLMIDQKDM